jgi:hypothetical protein
MNSAQAIMKIVDDKLRQMKLDANKMHAYNDTEFYRVQTIDIDKTAGTIEVLLEGETVSTTLTYTETDTPKSMTITWPDGHVATVSIS